MKNQLMKIYNRAFLMAIAMSVMVLLNGCKKLVEVDPPINEIIGKEIYKADATAASVLTGIYTDMSSDFGIFNGRSSISVRMGLYADELTNTTDVSDLLSALYRNALTNQGSQLFWSDLYAYVFRANTAIEGLTESNSLSAPVKRQLLGEARFVRAFMYFYLVNLYGDVPLLVTTDIKTNSSAPRTEKQKVYEQMITDLQEAQQLLSDEYVGGNALSASSDRVRPSKAVATALLARVYLFNSQWALAEAEATKILTNPDYELSDPATNFLSASREAIWQLQPTAGGRNTADAEIFVLLGGSNMLPEGPNGDNRPVYLNREVFDDFGDDDLRKSYWMGSVEVEGNTYPFPHKYKAWENPVDRTEYLMVFRMAEQYLIRAEARARQGNISGSNSASSDLDAARSRAGLGPQSFNGQDDLISKILEEKRKELFTEWGHRWFDLKRTGLTDQVMGIAAPKKGGSWAPYKALLPIPVEDLQRNPKLKGHQNPGYPEI